ncbi:MAG TPA: DUF2905 domain-containing protein, partial [Anaerolineales bacterium]|nr:DUF2905 domain-containing protein [Anaerolineales bacterium]HNA52769.1 DUF2905 domain-containing protein [Anaerolineales bacterium]HNC90579.1 DUF2905 domain-containing protein [Anaerolineales bacterium]HND93227.1 DUF2905 domain-containing protein [Anaerolineales bacterium]HNH79836.1 DUF2905 domain-containing protein [Anaerolineales bacterium]
ESVARYLMLGGIILFLIGGGVYLAARFGIPLGRLPGDIRIEGENGSFYFPVTSSILVSVILSLLLNLISKLMNK